MRIKTQFLVTMALFAVILVIAATSAIVTNHRIEKTGEQERIAAGVARGAVELGHLSNDYLIYRESQQLARWQSRFGAFSGQVAVLRVDTPEQQALVANIRANRDRMKAVFDSISAVPERPAGNRRALLDPAFLQVSWSRMAVQTQALTADALRLSQLLDRQMDRLTGRRTTLMYALVGLFGAFLLVSYWLTYRRVLNSIATLQAGAAIVGRGNLDFTIEERRSDEIGELSRAFNRMTRDLKAVTASKADLEREIVDRRRAEKTLAEHAAKLDEINKELESFSYSVSHDLRAPLRAIDGYSRMILKQHGGKFDDDAVDKFNVIRDSVRMMGQLIDDLLALSRVGRAELSAVTLDIGGVIREVWAELMAANPDRLLLLKLAELPPCTGDRVLIRQVLVNLLGNAVKFTRGRIEPLIEVAADNREGKTVYYVRDNGAGFDMQYHDKLFGVFQRLHSDAEFEGTGVGLAIVQRIIQRHGGRVWAEGEVDKGATFFFTLPTRQE